VLDLPPEKRQELADLLDRTTLAHVISASKVMRSLRRRGDTGFVHDGLEARKAGRAGLV
jgi:hypothetical protein